MKTKYQIQDFMTKCPQSIRPDETLGAAKGIMTKMKFRHLPVVDGSQIIGVLSERDVKWAGSVFLDDEFDDLLVEDICIVEPYVVKSDELLVNVVKKMANRKIGSALVVKDGELVGIFTEVDAYLALSTILETKETVQLSDVI